LDLSSANGAQFTVGISATTVTASGTIATGVYTVATLPAATSGSRALVSNALTPVFGSVAVGGGAVVSPVYADGSNWRIG
jgi:hypothetical protein